MQEGYWFVKLDEDSAPAINNIKLAMLTFMRQLREDL